jgi:DNA/RNA endonuclease G (NUC1)
MLGEGALKQDTPITFTPVNQQSLTLTIPEKFDFISAFELNIGSEDLTMPAQFAIPNTQGLEVGTKVFIARQTELPDENGNWSGIWMIEESAVVTADGMIRTQSPPWRGAFKSGTYSVINPRFKYDEAWVTAAITAQALGMVAFGAGVAVAFSNPAAGIVLRGIGDASSLVLAPYLLEVAQREIVTVTIPTVGLPYTTSSGVQINPVGVPTANVTIRPPAVRTADPFIKAVNLRLEDRGGDTAEQVIFISGRDFGDRFEDLEVELVRPATASSDEKSYKLEILRDLSQLTGTEQKLAVKPSTETVFHNPNRLQITRKSPPTDPRLVREFGSNEPQEYVSNQVKPPNPSALEYALVPLTFRNELAVFNAANPLSTVEATDSLDLLVARIPIIGAQPEDIRNVAVSSDGLIAYVPLERSGKLAIVDLKTLQQVGPLLELSPGAQPFSIVLRSDDKYAYLADRRSFNGKGVVYAVDIDPRSLNYGKTQIIQVGPAAEGLRQMTLSADGTVLFVTSPSGTRFRDGQGRVFVININTKDRPTVPGDNNPRKWHQEVGEIETGNGTTGITIAPRQPGAANITQIAFTNRRNESEGFGVITITGNNYSGAEVRKTALGLGSTFDYFDVNEAVSVQITNDGKYAFVVGRNSILTAGVVPSVDGDPRAGSNVGIIKDPLTPNAKLVAATRPIPDSWANGAALSLSDKFLTVTYPGVGSTFMFDVQEMIKTIENPGSYSIDRSGRSFVNPFYHGVVIPNPLDLPFRSATAADLARFPIDDINPDVSVAANLRPNKNIINFIDRRIDYETPLGSKTNPVATGGNPFSVTQASYRDRVNLLTPQQTDENFSESSLTPKFTWDFKLTQSIPMPTNPRDEVSPLTNNQPQIQKVELYVSVFPEGNGLLPTDRWTSLGLVSRLGLDGELVDEERVLPELSREEKLRLLTSYQQTYGDYIYGSDEYDYNPNRILTATWTPDAEGSQTGTWIWIGGQSQGRYDEFTLPTDRSLTAGQTYYWAVEATYLDAQGATQEKTVVKSREFETPKPGSRFGDNTFSNVTILTHGLALPNVTLKSLPITRGREIGIPVVDTLNLPDEIYTMAVSLAQGTTRTAQGTIAQYITAWDRWALVDENVDLSGIYSLNPSDWVGSDFSLLTEEQMVNHLRRNLGKPVVLLPNWATESIIPESGFTEGAADEFFAALVRLDQALAGSYGFGTNGKFERQGALLNSPLHFIGFSRGAVVNSEIIQRLGTFYNNPGGISPSGRVVHMTTIDPHDFLQDSLNLTLRLPNGTPLAGLDYTNFYEPKTQVWETVTFADNYYQTVPNLTGSTLTPAGRDIPNVVNDTGITMPRTGWPLNPNAGDLLGRPDLSILLGTNSNNQGYATSKPGFTTEERPDVSPGEVHGRAFTWYFGTADLTIPTEFSIFDEPSTAGEPGVFRRRGDSYGRLFDQQFYNQFQNQANPLINPWYVPNHQGVPANYNTATAPWEGIGTGWFYSVQGGGYDLRPISSTPNPRVPVAFDNSYSARTRGDFTVPTLFNGNFDVVTSPNNGTRLALATILDDLRRVPGWSYGRNGNGASFVTTTEFLINRVTDLPSTVYTPPAGGTGIDYAMRLEAGRVLTHNPFIVPDWGVLRFDLYAPNVGGNLAVSLDFLDDNVQDINQIIDLTTRAIGDEASYDADRFRIDYGATGFETFTIDIPEYARGKVATLRFQANRNTIYLDDVFFKSQHLLFGNPSEARKNDTASPNPNNYLLEKPQYALSYSADEKGPNWASYQINSSWLATSSPNRRNWQEDPELPFTNKVTNESYSNTIYTVGHLTDASIRNRSPKDYTTTFLYSNSLPQARGMNSRVWQSFELYLRDLARRDQKDVYVITGGRGRLNDDPSVTDLLGPNNSTLNTGVNIPSHFWKVAIVLERAGLSVDSITDVNGGGIVDLIAIDVPNDFTDPRVDTRNWEQWKQPVDAIETLAESV